MQKPRAETIDLWTDLLRAHRYLVTELDRELRAATGLTLDEYDVLVQLRSLGDATMNELSSRLLISRPSATRLVDQLVARGWIERSDDPHDRRVVRVSLTAAGRRAQSSAARVHLDGIARLVDDRIEGHDRTAVSAALHALGPPSPPGG